MLRLKFLRCCVKGRTQTDVAEATGLRTEIISKLETNRMNPTDRESKVLARFYGVDDPRVLFQHVSDPLRSDMLVHD